MLWTLSFSLLDERHSSNLLAHPSFSNAFGLTLGGWPLTLGLHHASCSPLVCQSKKPLLLLQFSSTVNIDAALLQEALWENEEQKAEILRHCHCCIPHWTFTSPPHLTDLFTISELFYYTKYLLVPWALGMVRYWRNGRLCVSGIISRRVRLL